MRENRKAFGEKIPDSMVQTIRALRKANFSCMKVSHHAEFCVFACVITYRLQVC